jgi:hypothetical protein
LGGRRKLPGDLPCAREVPATNGARRSEASELPRRELQGDVWLLPAARNKTKVDLARPLSAAALSVMPAGTSKFVFVSPTGSRPMPILRT